MENYTTPFFALRFTTVPIAVYQQLWSSDPDRKFDIGPLTAVIDQFPHLEEALYVASPELYAMWKNRAQATDVNKRESRKVYLSLLKYLIRATTRSTPYGLFAGCSLISSPTFCKDSHGQALVSPPSEAAAFRRFDNSFLIRLAHTLWSMPELLPFFRYKPNSSLYRVGSTWRYIEYEYIGSQRSYRLVRIDDDPIVQQVFDAARTGVSYQTLLALNLGDALELADKQLYINDLISSQLLVPDVFPNLTGERFDKRFFGRIREIVDVLPDTAIAHRLNHLLVAYDLLDKLNNQSPADSIDAYEQVMNRVSQSGFDYTPGQLFQVDLVHHTRQLALSENFTTDLCEAVTLLASYTYAEQSAALAAFTRSFVERFETQSVPLAIALDPEIGIPFLPDLSESTDRTVHSKKGEGVMSLQMQLYRRALRDKLVEINLEETDHLTPTLKPAPSLGRSLAVMARLVQIDEQPGLLLQGISGVSATTLLSRFTFADPALEQAVNQIVETEQQLYPDQILADLTHLPQDRVGNIAMRKTSRAYEIPYGVTSDRDSDAIIHISELVLQFRQGRLRLWSTRLHKEVVPILSNAHNFNQPDTLPLYRFLCNLQYSATESNPIRWDWGYLNREPFLPRIRYKQVIINPATWTIPAVELFQFQKSQQPVNKLMEVYGLPRYIMVSEGDRALLLDLTKPVSLDLMLDSCRDTDVLVAQESFYDPTNKWVMDPDQDGYAAEMIIPFVGVPGRTVTDTVELSRTLKPVLGLPPKYLPGSEWAYFKLYAGVSVCDDLLINGIHPLCTYVETANLASKWFFVRYLDPEHHLRVRFKMTSPAHLGELVQLFNQALVPYVEAGLVSRLCIDTYLPETERYGQQTFELSESLFHASSEFVLSLLSLTSDLDPVDTISAKQHAAIMLIDHILLKAGLNTAGKLVLAENNYSYLLHELPVQEREELKTQMSDYYRSQKNNVQQLLTKPADYTVAGATGLNDLIQVFAESTDLCMIRLTEALSSQRDIFTSVLTSQIHMTVNRIFADYQRVEELQIYDLYRRGLLAFQARSNRGALQEK